MTIKIIPISVIAAPNNWSPLKDTFWTITGGQAQDLWGQIVVVDALGQRPYVPANGAVLQVVFQRGDFVGSTTNKQLTVVKQAVLDANFRALSKIALTADESTNIISGTILVTLTEGTVVNKWAQNWAVKKLNTTAGF